MQWEVVFDCERLLTTRYRLLILAVRLACTEGGGLHVQWEAVFDGRETAYNALWTAHHSLPLPF